MDRQVFILGSRFNLSTLLLLATLLNATPARAEDFQGRVQKDSTRRIARPLAVPAAAKGTGTTKAQGAAVTAQLDKQSFLIHLDDNRLKAGLNTDILPPSLAANQAPGQTQTEPFSPPRAAQLSPLQVAGINYDAIEQAYEQSVPPSVVQAAGMDNNAPGMINLGTLAGRLAALAAEVVGPTGRPLGQTAIDVDNCACDTAMPSRQCLQERTSAIYGHIYSSASSPAFSLPAHSFSNGRASGSWRGQR
jgi:hypothetical protein